MVLASFLYFVSIFGGDFGNLWSFLLEIAVFGMNSGESPEKFPKIETNIIKPRPAGSEGEGR